MRLIKYSLKSEAVWILILSLTPFALGLLVLLVARLLS